MGRIPNGRLLAAVCGGAVGRGAEAWRRECAFHGRVRAGTAIGELTYSTLYVEHGYVNYRLHEPLHSPTVNTFEFRTAATTGDVMLWENHYAARLVPYEDVTADWYPIWKGSEAGFEAVILRRR